MSLPKLPIGVQSFEKMRTGGYAYVDKTRFISELVSKGSYYFLSRPRRFGKSLFIDTLDCAFPGGKNSFSGYNSILQERVGTLKQRTRFFGLILQEGHSKRSPISLPD